MSDEFSGKIRDRFNATAVGTNAGASATQALATGFRFTPTGIQCSGDAAALVTVESPSGTVLWRKRYAAAFTMSETFSPLTIVGAVSQALLVKVSASTSNSEANIQGLKIV